jgi:GT2 family glycosyltransferase
MRALSPTPQASRPVPFPKVSFIIPLYNCLPLTQAMLASLRATLPAGLEHEIIFVDDGSTDGTREWLATVGPALGAAPSSGNPAGRGTPASHLRQGFGAQGGDPAIRAILNDHNLGFARTCNRGAAVATGECFFFLNNDLVLLPHWIEPMLAAFGRRPDAALVGNVQLNHATGAVDHAGIFFNHQGKPAHLGTRPRAGGYREVDALTGACFAVPRGIWDQLGGFDEGYVNGCEDIDLCLRARAAGLACVVALSSRVRHHISQSAGRKLRDEQNTARLVGRWAETIAALAAPAWSREQVGRHAELSHVFDYPVVWAALWHMLFRGPPSLPVREGVVDAMRTERRRWRELLDGIPAPAGPCPQGPI